MSFHHGKINAIVNDPELKLMADMVKQPLGGSGGEAEPAEETEAEYPNFYRTSNGRLTSKHPYNEKTLQKCKYFGRIDSHADNESFGLEIKAHRRPKYCKKGKCK